MNRSTALLTASLLAAGAAAAYGAYVAKRRGWLRFGGYGSPTNASDAVDDFAQEPHASDEEALDTGVAQTFPASDPIAVGAASETAREAQRGVPKERDLAQEQPAPRSPDWMLERR